jgi:RNA polymerase sigma factor (sigma-70 family)
VTLTRRGSPAAFEVLVSRYHVRLLAFCRHLLGSREDAEDVLQEVFSAAFNAMLADDRSINVRPWLYRIARNRSLNHLRRIQAVGVDSMDVHLSDYGASTADKVHEREEFRVLVGDIQELPETQRTALVLREMDALSYEQIAEAMETTVPSVKSLLVRARVSLAEASEARLLTCDEVRMELGEVAEGLRRRSSPLIRRHLRSCSRCSTFHSQLRQTNKALAALLPVGPFVVFKKLVFIHLSHSASAGSGASSAGAAGPAAATAAAGTATAVSSTAGGFISAGVGAIATKAAAGLAAAALVTAGAVEVSRNTTPTRRGNVGYESHASEPAAPVPATAVETAPVHRFITRVESAATQPAKPTKQVGSTAGAKATGAAKATDVAKASEAPTTTTKKTDSTSSTKLDAKPAVKTVPGRTTTQTDPTVLADSAGAAATTPTTTVATTAPSTDTTTTTTTTTTITTSSSTAATGGASPDPTGSTSTTTTP